MSACERALGFAKQIHVDECEVVFVQKKITTVRITDSKIAEIKQNLDKNLGIRIIHQKKISSAQTNNIDDVKGPIEQAVKLAKFQKPKKFWQFLPQDGGTLTTIKKTFDKKLEEISGEMVVDIAQAIINAATNSKVSRISGSLNVVSENFEISNSSGLSKNDKGTYIAATINTESEKSSAAVSGLGHASCRTLEAFSAESVGNDAATMCAESVNPKKPESGKYSIIFDPYSVGELLAFVFAANFSLKTYSYKRSCFSDKIGTKVAVEDFSLVDDPHLPEGLGSKSFDEEGVATKPQPFIQKGVFKNLYSDCFYAFREGQKTSANAARSGSPMGRGAEPIPIPAPHNLRVTEGKMKRDEIIQDTKNGLLIGRLWYTYAVNPTKGDFSCTARSGIRIIKGGQIIGPGSSVRIIHNMPKMIQEISAIGNDSKNVLQWASLPSTAPTIKAENIKVSSI